MDGRIVAQGVRSKLREQVKILKRSKVEPNLATILVGDNPASKAYLRYKHKACAEDGILSRNIELAAGTSQEHLEKVIRECEEIYGKHKRKKA